jgi:hypothetical protein
LRYIDGGIDWGFEAFSPDLVECAARMPPDGVVGPHPHDEEA